MKKILGVVVILAAIVLGSYYGMGCLTEHTLKKDIDSLNQSNGLMVEVLQYNRHWFSADTLIKAQLHIAEHVIEGPTGQPVTAPAEDYTIDIPVKVFHGPVIVASSGVKFGLGFAESEIKLPKPLMDKYSALFDTSSSQPVLKTTIFVGFNKTSRIGVAIPSFKLIPKQGKGEFVWQGLEGNVNVSSDNTRIDGGFSVDGVNIVKDQMTAVLGHLTSHYNLHKTSEGLFLGEAGVYLPLIDVTQDKTKVFGVEEFKAKSESDIREGLFSTSFNTSLEKLFLNGVLYGPGELSLSIKNIDAAVLATISAHANKMKQSLGTDRQQAMFAMIPEFPKLFAKGATFELSTLKLTLPEGDVTGQMELVLPKEVMNPFQIIQKIEGNGKFQVPVSIVKRVLTESIQQRNAAQTPLQQAMVNQMHKDDATTADSSAPAPSAAETATAAKVASDEADKKLASLAAAKVLTQDGNNYVVVLRLTLGNLTINGQPFDPSMFRL